MAWTDGLYFTRSSDRFVSLLVFPTRPPTSKVEQINSTERERKRGSAVDPGSPCVPKTTSSFGNRESEFSVLGNDLVILDAMRRKFLLLSIKKALDRGRASCIQGQDKKIELPICDIPLRTSCNKMRLCDIFVRIACDEMTQTITCRVEVSLAGGPKPATT